MLILLYGYAEYYWSIEEYDKIAFHLTNGFYMNYTKWREGYRIKVEGNDVKWVKTASYDDSYETFFSYLNMVYAYAGTLSLAAESTPITLDELLPGDILLEGGSPGHCVMVVDMAYNEEGSRCYLLAQAICLHRIFISLPIRFIRKILGIMKQRWTIPYVLPLGHLTKAL